MIKKLFANVTLPTSVIYNVPAAASFKASGGAVVEQKANGHVKEKSGLASAGACKAHA